ncbi:MAG TPA: hypothetical protein DCR14_02820 [Acidimicrobiaceae bacterium]|nr:hypothetical protein [Acidimicrobiaceae bacterium]
MGWQQRWRERPARVLARSDRLVLTRLRRSDASAVEAAIDDDVRAAFDWVAGDDEREVLRVRKGQFNLFLGKPADFAVRDGRTNTFVGCYRAGWDGLDLTASSLTLRGWVRRNDDADGIGGEALRLVVGYLSGERPRPLADRRITVDVMVSVQHRNR